MGLISRNKELKRLEMRLEFLEFLKEYGITPNDLHYLHEAIEYVKKEKENPKEVNSKELKPTKEEVEKYKKEKSEKMTPEQFINQFAGEVEEFYPYGKPKDND